MSYQDCWSGQTCDICLWCWCGVGVVLLMLLLFYQVLISLPALPAAQLRSPTDWDCWLSAVLTLSLHCTGGRQTVIWSPPPPPPPTTQPGNTNHKPHQSGHPLQCEVQHNNILHHCNNIIKQQGNHRKLCHENNTNFNLSIILYKWYTLHTP